MELFVEQGGLAGQVLRLERPVVVVGRGGEMTPDRVALPEQAVSRQHASLQYGPQGWMLTDLGSTNGTYLNGQRIRERQPHPLHLGDRVAMGETILVVRQVEAPGIVTAEKERRPGRLHPALLATGAFLLVVMLVGIVVLLVLILQPESEEATPTPGDQMERIMTVLPVPTEFQDMATSVIPLIPTELPLPLFGPTSTPTPEAVLPAQQGSEPPHVLADREADVAALPVQACLGLIHRSEYPRRTLRLLS